VDELLDHGLPADGPAVNDEQQARLKDIRSGPWRDKSRLARATIPKLSAAKARRYFRSHLDEEIEDDAEMDFRESFDQALEELQLVELAVACGYLDLDVVRPVAEREFDALLGTAPAREYLKIYDFMPVRFLAARIDRDLGLGAVRPPSVDPHAALSYATFLAIHRDFVASPPVENFCQLLDDYYWDDLDARRFRDWLDGGRVTRSRERLIAELGLGVGFVEFVDLLGESFLRLEPRQHALFGCLYAYWLSHFFGFRRTKRGYKPKGVSFQRAKVPAALFSGDLTRDVVQTEQARIAARIRVLGSVWKETRGLLESLDAS
jgi:hypothetical protein